MGDTNFFFGFHVVDASMGVTRSNYMDITGRPASSRDESYVSDSTGIMGSAYNR
jgi:hypothetical protein